MPKPKLLTQQEFQIAVRSSLLHDRKLAILSALAWEFEFSYYIDIHEFHREYGAALTWCRMMEQP